MERARINWEEGQQYDDWDEIAQALFSSIVAQSLWNMTLGEDKNPLLDVPLEKIIPRYNMLYENYSDFGRIEIYDARAHDNYVFVGLSTSSKPFDTGDFIILDEKAAPKSKSLIKFPFDQTDLCFRNKNYYLTDLSVSL